MKDRYTKIMLFVVAGLLAANLAQSLLSGSRDVAPLFVSDAQARTIATPIPTNINYMVRNLKGYKVEDLKDVVAVGDGSSFVVSNSSGFMVYQVVPSR